MTAMSSKINLRFHDLLMVELETRIKTREGQLGAGQPKDWEHYREGVGYIRALRDALGDAEEIRLKLVEER